MQIERKLSIILLSFNDLRVLRAIESIRRMDDADTIEIVVVDGGSTPELVEAIRENLSEYDQIVSEKDRGIFDALNKGLRMCRTVYLGWLGSDDVFTGEVLSSQVLSALEYSDLFVCDLRYFRDGFVTRAAHSLPARRGMVRFGLNNPHFSTFGRTEILASEQFDLFLRGADIEYFLRVFRKGPRVACTARVSTLQEEGGFSNKNWSGVVRTNLELLPIYARHTNWFLAPILVLVKLILKLVDRLYYKIYRVPVPSS